MSEFGVLFVLVIRFLPHLLKATLATLPPILFPSHHFPPLSLPLLVNFSSASLPGPSRDPSSILFFLRGASA